MGRNKKIVIAKFDKKIYKKRAIQKAIKSYGNLVDINLREDKDFYHIEFINTPEEYRGLIDGEFGNYVLALMRG